MTSSAPAPSLGQGEIRCLTGLRGCAAILVMLYHFTLVMPAGTVPLQRVFSNGYLWVDLFFVLSGFVLAYAQATQFTTTYRPRQHARFLVSRVARVYPLYAVVILESACLLSLRTGHLDAGVLGLNLAMVQGWGLAPSLEGAAWSVSTEWGAYLLFPLLLCVSVLMSRRIAVCVALGAVATLAVLSASAGPFAFPGQGRHGPLDLYSHATVAPLLRCLAEFCLGLLTFRVADALAARRQAGVVPDRLIETLGIAIAVLLFGLLCLHGFDLPMVLLFCALLATLSQETGVLAKGLANTVFYQLGRWSYSIYLLHDKFSRPAETLRAAMAPRVPFASVVAILATSVAVIGCGALTFALVEQPLRRLVLRVPSPATRRRIDPLPVPTLELGT